MVVRYNSWRNWNFYDVHCNSFELLLGFEKGRIVIIILTLSPMVFANFLLNYIPLINLNSLMVKILILLCLITLILTSYFITSNLYAKKDL